tara:strand:+ start:554 stop:826 length:273 start_codon:yes stop_codon:yes gene_type:complete
MPQHKSSKKRVKQDIKKKLENNILNSRYKSSIKNFLENIEKKDFQKSSELFKKVNSLAFKASNKGIIKRRTASRKISNLAKLVNSKISPK